MQYHSKVWGQLESFVLLGFLFLVTSYQNLAYPKLLDGSVTLILTFIFLLMSVFVPIPNMISSNH